MNMSDEIRERQTMSRDGKCAMAATAFISLLPWILYVVFVLPASAGMALEAAWFWVLAIGALSFSLTGPLAVMAAVVSGDSFRPLGARGIVLYAALAVPTLSFQSIVLSASVMPVVIFRPTLDARHAGPYMAIAAAISIVWYTVLFFIAWVAIRGSHARMTTGVIALTVASIVIIVILATTLP